MKVNERLRFPHPVLNPFSDDFGVFGMSLDITVEEIPSTSALSLNCILQCDHKQLNEFRASGDVKCYANVICLGTYFNEFHELTGDRTSLEIAPGLLRGTTIVRPICVAATRVDVGTWEGVHFEFSKASCAVPKHGVIAIGDEFRLDVGLDKLRPMESIFRLARKETLEEGEIAIDLETQYIRINAAPNLYATITALRNIPATRNVLLNSVYFAATLEVLSLIGDDSETFQDRWWFRVFIARCTQLAIDPTRCDLLEATQILLNRPLARLHKLEEIVE